MIALDGMWNKRDTKLREDANARQWLEEDDGSSVVVVVVTVVASILLAFTTSSSSFSSPAEMLVGCGTLSSPLSCFLQLAAL